MDENRVDQIIQYALATSRCAHDDDRLLQDLGPIHLIKYVYLADMAYAQEYGETFTGATWKFHHFGPWAAEVNDRIEPAMAKITADKKKIESNYGDDFIRWRIPEYNDAEQLCVELRGQLPVDVHMELRRKIQEYGNATAELLHYVYITAPMLNAAPNEEIEFSTATKAKEQEPQYQAVSPAPLRRKAQKMREKRLAEARIRLNKKVQERIRKRNEQSKTQPPPRYDEVFEEGTRKLDELAGPHLDVSSGDLEFSDSIWKSSARTGVEWKMQNDARQPADFRIF